MAAPASRTQLERRPQLMSGLAGTRLPRPSDASQKGHIESLARRGHKFLRFVFYGTAVKHIGQAAQSRSAVAT